jgi:hypothetical protein
MAAAQSWTTCGSVIRYSSASRCPASSLRRSSSGWPRTAAAVPAMYSACQHDEEEYILPLIAEHLTVAEWERMGQRFAEEVPKSKMLFFLGMILEDADPAGRQAMMANLPVPARFAWAAFGQRQFRRRVGKIRAGLS